MPNNIVAKNQYTLSQLPNQYADVLQSQQNNYSQLLSQQSNQYTTLLGGNNAQPAQVTSTQFKMDFSGMESANRSWAEALADTGLSVAKGVTSLGEMAYGMADTAVMGLDRATGGDGSVALSNIGDNAIGRGFQSAREGIESLQSESLQASRARQERVLADYAEGREQRMAARALAAGREENNIWDQIREVSGTGWNALRDTLSRPDVLLDTTIESGLSFLVPGGVAAGLSRAGIGAAANSQRLLASGLSKRELNRRINQQNAAIGVASIGAMEGSSNAVQSRNRVLEMGFDELRENSPVFSSLVDEGYTEEQARQIAANNTFLTTFAIAGTVASGSSFITGAGRLEASLFRNAASGLLRGTPRTATGAGLAALQEGVQEIFQSGGGELAQNQAIRMFANVEQSLIENVGEGAGIGFAAGGTAGGVMSAAINTARNTAATGQGLQRAAERGTAAKVQAETGVQSDFVREAMNPMSNRFNPVEGAKAMVNDTVKASEALQTPEARRKYYEEVNTSITDAMFAVKQYASVMQQTPGKDSEYNKAQETITELHNTRAKLLKDFTDEKERIRQFDIARQYLKDMQNTNAGEDIRRAIFEVYGSSENSFTTQELRELSKSNDPVISDLANASINTQEETKRAVNLRKSKKQVDLDIIEGGPGFIGMNQYREFIVNAYQSNNPEQAQQYLFGLAKFAEHHNNKAALGREILDGLAAGQDTTAQQEQYTENYSPRNPETGEKLNEAYINSVASKGLVERIEQEAIALEALVNEMTLVTEQVTQNRYQGTDSNQSISTALDSAIPWIQNNAERTDGTAWQRIQSMVNNIRDNAQNEELRNQAQELSEVYAETQGNNVEIGSALEGLQQLQALAQGEVSTETTQTQQEDVQEPSDIVTEVQEEVAQQPQEETQSEVAEEVATSEQSETQSATVSEATAESESTPVRFRSVEGQRLAQRINQLKRAEEISTDRALNMIQAIKDGRSPEVVDALNKLEKRTNVLNAERAQALGEATGFRFAQVLKDLDLNYPRKKIKNGLGQIQKTLEQSIAQEGVGRNRDYVSRLAMTFIDGVTDAIKGFPGHSKMADGWYKSGYDLAKRVFVPKMNSTERVVNRNLVQDITDTKASDFLAVSKRKNPLVTQQNWFEELENDPSMLDGLEPNERDAYDRFKQFRSNFAQALQDHNKRDQLFGHLLKNNPSNFLLNENGEFDSNTITAMAAAAYNGITDSALLLQGKGDELVRSALGLNTKDPIPRHVNVDKIRKLGVPKKWVHDTVTNAIKNTLGLRLEKSATNPEMYYKTINALGSIAIDLLASDSMQNVSIRQTKTKYIEILTKEIFEPVDENKTAEQLEEEQKDLPPAMSTSVFMRLMPNNEVNNNAGIIDGSSQLASRNMFTKIFGDFSSNPMPTYEPVKFTQKYLKRTRALIPKKQAQAADKYNHQANGIKTTNMDIANAFGEEFHLFIAGYLDEDALKRVHISERSNVRDGKNPSILRDVQALLEFYDEAGDRDFYILNEIWKNMRMGMVGLINPQNSKYHRHMMGFRSLFRTVGVKDKAARRNFKLAVAQHFGLDVDKKSNATIKAELKEITEAAEVQSALSSIRAMSAASATMEPQAIAQHESNIRNGIEYIQSKTGHDERTAIYDALVNYSRYKVDEAFETDIFLEVDGITNGPIIAQMQVFDGTNQAEFKQRMNAGGVFFVGDMYENYSQYKEDGNDDTYEFLGKDWQNRIIRTVHTDLQRSMEILIGNINKPAIRKLAKEPTMTTVYGSGTKRIVTATVESLYESIYQRLMGDISTRDSILNELSRMGVDLDSKQVELKNNNQMQDFLFDRKQEATIKEALKTVYGDTLKKSLRSVYGDFVQQQRDINHAINFQFQVFQHHFEEMKALQLKVEQLENPDIKALPEYLEEEIFDSIIDTAPMIKTFFSTGMADSLLAMKTENSLMTDPAYQSQVEYTAPIKNYTNQKGKPTKKSSTFASKLEFIEAGAGGFVTLTHAQDAAIMMMTLAKHDVLNVHDAIGASVFDVDQAAADMNQNFMEVIAGYNMVEEVVVGLGRSFQFLTDTYPSMTYQLFDQAYNKDVPDMFRVDPHFFMDNMRNKVKANIDAKRLMLENISHVGQYYHERGQARYSNTETLVNSNRDSYALELSDAYVAEIKRRYEQENPPEQMEMFTPEDDSMGSGPDSMRQFSADESNIVNATNSTAMLDQFLKLDQNTVSKEHAEHLMNVVTSVVNPKLTEINLEVQNLSTEAKGAYFRKGNVIRMQTANASANGTLNTNSEVYVHELTHAILSAGLAQPSQERNALTRFYQAARKHITVADLTPQNATQAQREQAQKMYDYIFNNMQTQTNNRTDRITDRNIPETFSRGLDEFLAYALTNESVINALNNNKALQEEVLRIRRPGLERRETTGGFIPQAATAVMNWLLGQINRVLSKMELARMKLNNQNPVNSIMTLAQRIADIQNQNLHRVSRDKYIDKADSLLNRKILDWVFTPIGLTGKKLMKMSDGSKGLGSIVNIAGASMAMLDPKIDPLTSVKAIRNVSRKMGLMYDGLLSSIAREMIGQTKFNRIFYALQRESKTTIDQASKKMNISIKQLLNEAMHTSVSEAEKQALTRAGIKTDLSALLIDNFDLQNMDQNEVDATVFGDKGRSFRINNYARIRELMEDQGARNNEINNLISQLQQITNGGQLQAYQVRQAKGLGALISGNVANNITELQMSNAHAIAQLAGGVASEITVSKTYNREKAERIVDRLATLYALDYTDQTDLDNFVELWKREAQEAGSEDVNGVTYFLQQHVEYKKQSEDKLFSNGRMQMQKGYMREITDPNVNFMVAEINDENIKTLSRKGYRLHKRVQQDRAGADIFGSNQGLFVSYSDFPATWQKTTLSLTSNKARGTAVAMNARSNGLYTDANGTIVSINESVIERKRRQRNQSYTQSASTQGNSLVPVLDDKGNITGLRYVMEESTRRELLKRHDNYDDVMGQMYGHMVNKTNSKVMNKRAIQELKKIYDSRGELGREDDSFIRVGLISSDQPNRHLEKRQAEYEEMWQMLPEQTKQDVQEIFGEKALYVPESAYQLIFGYRRNNLRDFTKRAIQRRQSDAMNKTEMQRTLNAALLPALQHINNFVGHKYFVTAESFYKELVAFVKDTIVIKTGTVLVANITSNTLMLMMSGVNPIEIAKYHKEGYKAVRDYQTDTMEINKIEQRLKSDRSLSTNQRRKLEADLNFHKDSLARNPAKDILDAGVYQSIVEDVSLEEEPFSYASRLERAAKPITSKVPQVIKDVGNTVFMTHDTQLYKALRNTTQISDFVARYTLHKVNTTKRGMSFGDSVNDIMDSFVDYESPSHDGIQYLNEVGFLMFTKFFFRIQKMLVKRGIENPASVLSVLLLQQGLGYNLSDVFDVAMSPDTLMNRQYSPAFLMENILAGNIFNFELAGGIGRPMN